MESAGTRKEVDDRDVLFISARDALEQYLSAPEIAARKLDAAGLRSYANRHAVAGWRLSVAFTDRVHRELDILLSADFPFVAPRIALVDRSRFLLWPHVESDGVLCLLEDQDPIDHRAPVQVVQRLLADAAQLIEDSLAGRNRQDLLVECNSYWSHATSKGNPGIRSLVRLEGPSRIIRWWNAASLMIAADSEVELARWAGNYLGRSKIDGSEFSDGLLVWLPAPLYPSEFPTTAADLRALVREQNGTALDLLERLAGPQTRRIQILLAAPLPEGVFMGGIILSSPSQPRGYGTPQGDTLPGFRKGHVPKEIQLPRFFGSQRIQRADVARSDVSWVHGRGHDAYLARLQAARVAIIGCGSVGASVSIILAQSGVGNFILVDPQLLASPNTSRHPLGSQDVGQRKCVALAKKLRADFPHLQSVKDVPRAWESMSADEISEVQQCDLIICAIGNIGIELAINHWATRTRQSGTVLYAWLEPFACAAHAVALVNQGCFECGFDHRNQPKSVATEWPSGLTAYREPGCAATFQPYGAVELITGVSMIAELALDSLMGLVDKSIERIRVGGERRLRERGGSWSTFWKALAKRDEGDFTLERSWDRMDTCQRCNRS